MDEQLNLFQTPTRLAQLAPGQTLLGQLRTLAPALHQMLGITPAVAVVDADLLLRDLKYTLSHNIHTALMVAARTGLLRLYAALPVWYEVSRHVDDRAEALGWDASQARDVWRRCYAPWIYFIDAMHLPVINPYVLEGIRRDPTDVQTAQLVIALTPEMFLSCNEKHFPGLQPVGERWLTVSLAYRDKFVRDISAMESTLMWSVGGSISLSGLQGLVRGVAHLDRRVLIGGIICLFLVAVFAAVHRPTREAILEGATTAWSEFTEAFGRIVPPLLDQAARRDEAAYHAQEVLGLLGRTSARPRVVRDIAATALARMDAVLSVGQLQSAMTRWGYASDSLGARQYVCRVLRGQPGLFREDSCGRWGLSVLRAIPRRAAATTRT